MTKTRFRKELGKIRSIVREFEECNGKIGFLFGRDAIAENVFLQQVYHSVDLAIKYLAELSGDEGEWIQWFVYECDFGRKPMSAFINKVETPCRSAADLWEIIHANDLRDLPEKEANQ